MLIHDPDYMRQVANHKINADIRRAEQAALIREARRTRPAVELGLHALRLRAAVRAVAHQIAGWPAHLHVRPHRV